MGNIGKKGKRRQENETDLQSHSRDAGGGFYGTGCAGGAAAGGCKRRRFGYGEG